MAAAHTGHRVAFAPATGLAEAHRTNRLKAELRKIARYGLFILTSNLPLSRWGQIFAEATIRR
nr:hypothetical protein [Mycobacterium intracellulare]